MSADLFNALNMFNQGMTQLATGRAIRGAAEEAKTINMGEQDEFARRQKLTQLGTGLAAQLSSYGASPEQIKSSVGSFMPQQLNGPQDFFAASQQATNPEAQKQLAQAGQNMQGQIADAPLNNMQKETLGLEYAKLANAKKAVAADAQQKLGEKGLKISEDLFNKWTTNQVTKDSQNISVQYQKMKSAVPLGTAASDMSLIFGFMKMQDPGSTVREGEYATAEQAGPVAGRYLNLYNKAIKGQKLTAAQRQDFLKTANQLYKSQLTQQKRFDKTLRQRAGDLGIDPSKVTLGETLFGNDYSLDDAAKEDNTPSQIQSQQSAPAAGFDIMSFIK